MNFVRANLLSFLALAAMLLTSLALYGSLPDQIPSGFNLDGTVQEMRPKQLMAVLLPAIYLVLIAFINVLINLSPRKFSMPNSKRPMDIIVFGVGLLLAFIHYSILVSQGDFSIAVTYISYGVAAFLVVVGNVFGKTERNFFIGVRLPWTIASTANWKATHRFAGRLMVVMGLLLLVSNTLIPNLVFTLVLCGIAVLLPVVYSPLYYFRHERTGAEAHLDDE